jgi:hypothetical protein
MPRTGPPALRGMVSLGSPHMISKLRLIAAAAAFAATAVVAVPAQAQVMDSVLSALGLKPAEEVPEIDYRERPPLVVPPQMKLRPPEAPPSARSAAWPNDPDVARRAAEAKAAKTPRPNARESDIGDGKLMRPGDIPGGRTARSTAPQDPATYTIDHGPSKTGWMSPDKLRSMGTTATPEKSLVAGQEPPRRYLTDPPAGLRVPSDRGPMTAGRTLVRPAVSERDEKDPLNTYRPKPKNPDDD